MDQVEKRLNIGKEKISRLEVPDELETRLRNALENKALLRRAKHTWMIRLAAGFIAIALIGYNFDALAYYGKKFIGYNQVMNGTLRQLNDLGKGQIIGKRVTVRNGVTVTLDGIMLDQNQMLVFYSIKEPKGNIENVDVTLDPSIKGFFGRYYMSSGYGKMNDAKTEIKYISSFDIPFFLEKNLTLSFSTAPGGQRGIMEIAFAIDRSKAMGYKLKKTINQTIEVDESKIHFNSIVASPTKTVIEGSLQNIVELAADQFKGERFRPGALRLKLIANGKAVPEQGGGMSTDLKGITFHQDYDTLPDNLKQLQLQLVSFGADHDVSEQVKLQKDVRNHSFNILGQDIQINRVYEERGDTFLSITTEDSVVLTRVYLIIDGHRTTLQETISDRDNKRADGIITHTRVLHFPGSGNQLSLDIQRMRYEKVYNQLLSIPLD